MEELFAALPGTDTGNVTIVLGADIEAEAPVSTRPGAWTTIDLNDMALRLNKGLTGYSGARW